MAKEGKSKTDLATDAVMIAVKTGNTGILYWVGIVIVCLFLFVIGLGAIAYSAQGQVNDGGGVNAQPSPTAQQMIPPGMLTLYRSQLVQRQCPGLPWTITAAIGHIESDDWRNQSTSSAGALGPMQFLIGTWGGQEVIRVGRYGKVPNGHGYGIDGDGDGFANIRDPYDAVPAAARYLCANGGGNPNTLRQAIFQYNHADWYVNEVMTLAAHLGRTTDVIVGNPSMGSREATGFAVSRTGTPYVWGGSSPEGGFDCSGLVWWAYSQAGFPFSRTTAAGEYNWPGIHVGYDQLQEGDIVFWGPDPNDPATIDHAAMYVGVIPGYGRAIIVAREPGTNVQYETLYHDSGDLHFVAGLRVALR